jgi:hypothetical protein
MDIPFTIVDWFAYTCAAVVIAHAFNVTWDFVESRLH